jgi:CxxC motif-containing protein (DUF1111 family)
VKSALPARSRHIGATTTAVSLLCLASCEPQPDVAVELLGGPATVRNASGKAFTFPAPPLNDAQRDTFSLGDHFFNRNWVSAPASTSGFDGLGPTFNATSCSACHNLDGRAAPPKTPQDVFLGLLLRISVPGQDPHGGPNPVPGYGDQIQHRSILGVPPEATPSVRYEEVEGQYPDGERWSLRRPVYSLQSPQFGALPQETMVSPRIATAMIGLGLLESVSEETLKGLEDADDRNDDGISGRVNWVWNAETQAVSAGRFGWKANQPTLRQQAAAASLGDMGISTPMLLEQNCPAAQLACGDAPNGDDVGAKEPEMDVMKFDAIVDYSKGLAVPARRAWTDATVKKGEALFSKIGCAGCHLPLLQGGQLERFAELSNIAFRPFTDLLLHDLGLGLADGRPDFGASGSEWRTAPLWGHGLQRQVNGHQFLLHDGRARGFEEAILWHGGEAEAAKIRFSALTRDERQALIRFLEDL